MYDPKFSQKQMYDQYGRSRQTKKEPVMERVSPDQPEPSRPSTFDQFKRRETNRGLGSKPRTFGGGQDNNPNRDEAENKSTIKKVFERAVDLFKSFGADEPKDVIVDGKRVYQGPLFRGYDPTVRIGNFGGEYGKQQYLFGAKSLPIGASFGPKGIKITGPEGIKITRSPVPPTLPPGTVNRLGVNTDNPRLNMFGVSRGFTKPPALPELPTSPDVPANMQPLTRALSQGLIPTEVDYTIKEGDTLSEIAQDRGTTVEVLMEMNNIKEEDKDTIFTGDILRVPVKRLTATQAALRRGLGSKKDMSGVQVASLDPKYYLNEQGEITSDGFYDPESEYIESFRPGITPIQMLQTTGDDTYFSPDYMSDVEILARTIEKEAGGESNKGKLAVGAVIANRIKKQSWMGKDLRSVILKPGQFSPWNSYTNYAGGEQGKEMLGVTAKPSEASYEAARKILSGDYEDPTKGATHFVNPKISKPSWYGKFKDNDPLKIGKHQFGSPDNPNWSFQKSLRPKIRPKGLGAK